ncbi:MAG: nuclear transport factor 2 family protein [Nitrososphaerota archaeon]|nr:nuclear transport factor 2 family protein [Nitrososphaerota archaeon]
MNRSANPKELVTSYIAALHEQRYEDAMVLLQDNVRIRGPAGETYGKPTQFVETLRKYRGKYDIKRMFADGEDVCVLYDLVIGQSAVYMSSWYQVRDGKITSINTIFDPSAMGSPPGSNPTQRATR